MHLRQGVLRGGLVLLLLGGLVTPGHAGMLGFPAARLQPYHFRFEIAGDSFKESLQNVGKAEATTGRALTSVAFGLSGWSEMFARFGVAEFNLDEALFNGGFGVAYGGGLRLRLLSFPLGVLGASGQYLRFTSTDTNSAGVRVEGRWEEFDVAAGLGTKRIKAFALYLGGAYHRSDITLKPAGTVRRQTLTSETPFRLFLGVHIFPLVDDPSGRFLVNIEARLIGETPQVTLGIQYAL